MRLISGLAIFLTFVSAHAVTPDEALSDPVLEARARTISQEVRCVVCQNQSIDDSAAPLARDLRVIVREQLSAGKTDQGVKDYLVKRYGTFVLLKPPFNKATLFLWFGPFILALVSALGVWRYVRSRQSSSIGTTTILSAEEEQRAADLINQL
jgi:cytochrome c-type biogenesis protein CcmH